MSNLRDPFIKFAGKQFAQFFRVLEDKTVITKRQIKVLEAFEKDQGVEIPRPFDRDEIMAWFFPYGEIWKMFMGIVLGRKSQVDALQELVKTIHGCGLDLPPEFGGGLFARATLSDGRLNIAVFFPKEPTDQMLEDFLIYLHGLIGKKIRGVFSDADRTVVRICDYSPKSVKWQDQGTRKAGSPSLPPLKNNVNSDPQMMDVLFRFRYRSTKFHNRLFTLFEDYIKSGDPSNFLNTFKELAIHYGKHDWDDDCLDFMRQFQPKWVEQNGEYAVVHFILGSFDKDTFNKAFEQLEYFADAFWLYFPGASGEFNRVWFKLRVDGHEAVGFSRKLETVTSGGVWEQTQPNVWSGLR